MEDSFISSFVRSCLSPTREDVIECAKELDIPEEAITDEVLEEIKKGVDWGMEFWSDVVKEAIRIAIDR